MFACFRRASPSEMAADAREVEGACAARRGARTRLGDEAGSGAPAARARRVPRLVAAGMHRPNGIQAEQGVVVPKRFEMPDHDEFSTINARTHVKLP